MRKLIAPRMLEFGYSQRALAEKAGIDEETVEGALYGMKYPEPKSLKRMASELHLTWADLRRARQQLPKPSPPAYIRRLFHRGGRQARLILEGRGRVLGKGYRDQLHR